jgi:hypothetical protein
LSNGSPECDCETGFACAIAFRYNGLQRLFDLDPSLCADNFFPFSPSGGGRLNASM